MLRRATAVGGVLGLILGIGCRPATPSVIVAPVATPTPPSPSPATPRRVPAGRVSGVITHAQTRGRITDATVTLECDCLDAPISLPISPQGIYTRPELGPGNYSLTVESGLATVIKRFELPKGARFRANFTIDPDTPQRREVTIRTMPIDRSRRSLHSTSWRRSINPYAVLDRYCRGLTLDDVRDSVHGSGELGGRIRECP